MVPKTELKGQKGNVQDQSQKANNSDKQNIKTSPKNSVHIDSKSKRMKPLGNNNLKRMQRLYSDCPYYSSSTTNNKNGLELPKYPFVGGNKVKGLNLSTG